MTRPPMAPRQLPRRQPRLLFHSGSARHLVRAVDFYRPVTARARIARHILVAALRLGGPWVVRLVGSPVSEETAAVLEAGVGQLCKVVEEPLGGIVGGYGAPGPDRKVTLVALARESATPLAFAKISAAPDAALAVRQEAQALQVVQRLSLGVQVPQMLRWRTVGPLEVVVLSPLAGVAPWSYSGLDFGRLAFLRRLAEVPRTGAAADLKGAGAVLSHGDFTPWNCLYEGRGLSAVIDWECLAWRTPGYDLVHHEVQRRVHFSGLPVDAEVRSLLRQTPPLLAAVSTSHASLVCIREYCAETLGAAGAERWSERGIELRAALLRAIPAGPAK